MVTAVVDILSTHQRTYQARSLIDTCSTSNFMTQNMSKSLGLKIHEHLVAIGALNTLSTKSRGYVTATIRSRYNEYEKTLKFIIVPTISASVPSEPVHRAAIKIPSNIKLADPNFHQPAPVDILLGSGIALSLLCIGQINLSGPTSPELYLQKTILGWVIGGSAPTSQWTPHRSSCLMTAKLHFELSKFWEIEEGPAQGHQTIEETACEEHYRKTVTRNKEGRFTVALPFNAKMTELGESREQAIRRFHSTERRLSRDTTLQREYDAVLQDYIQLGHMSMINEEQEALPGYYLPHQAVIKESSMTTKLRVVFDRSAKTTTGVSLNDALMVGPTIQTDLFSLLIRFRIHPIVLTADIEKMYRQFLIRPEDRRYQRIIWKNAEGKPQSFELNTVTFGLSAAPYLAIRSLHQLADEEGERFPIAAKRLKEDFYVDDALTGTSTKEEAIMLRDQLIELLKQGGLKIRQWASNDPTLLKDLPGSSINVHLQLGESTTIKTLGIFWDSRSDSIVYTVKNTASTERVTKRSILSETARIFDPLGLLAPVIILAKMLLQRLWSLKLDWDESLPSSLHSEWEEYYQQLSRLNNIMFTRRTMIYNTQERELHGFCDASEKAYGACLYLRTIDEDGNIEVQLLCAKTRVAPLKTVSIPRLELCGALLLTTLSDTVKRAMPYAISQEFFWTDSMIVLHWLRTPPHQLKTFVANRVSEIQSKTNTTRWFHVRTKDNPADLLSRGQLPIDFIRPSIWKKGPKWLSGRDSWPKGDFTPVKDLPETKQVLCYLTPATAIKDTFRETLLSRYSSMERLQRIIAYCLRWREVNHQRGPITIPELRRTHTIIIKMVQQERFASEIHCLRVNKPIENKGKLLRLRPFIDQEGILRVGGRLQNASLPFAERHPIILPKTHNRYWPIDGRGQVWKVIHDCVTCCKAKPPSLQYVMGNLPAARVTESRPFTHVGVDYCGPFLLKERKYRNRGKIKVYVAVFICLAIKAVHLEIISDLTSDGFLAALRRFMARRGMCTNIYSDNGTNFVGANNHLREIAALLRSEDCQTKIQQFLSSKSIRWHFIPPRSPHFGGLWEAAVKSFKHHLRRVAGVDLLFTFEEFNTLVTEIEAVLNSRPLTPLSSDPNDLTVLTPGHFLIGDSLTSLRERDYTSIPANRLSAWQHLFKIKRDFWIRWRKEYLNELTCRSKWSKGQHSIDINSVVLLKEDHVTPLQWPMGRVIETHPETDGVIRTVTIKTVKGIVKRNLTSIAPLPIQHTGETQQSKDMQGMSDAVF